MKPETLEALITDQALGALPPEVDALLADYLAHNAEAAQTAAQTRQALRLTEQLMGPDHRPLMPPPFPGTVLRRAHQRQLAWRRAGHALALAACVAIGVFVGQSFHHAAPPPSSKPVARADASAPALALRTPRSPQFWTVQRWYDLAQTAPRPEPADRSSLNQMPSL